MSKKKKMRFLVLQGTHYHEKVRYDSRAEARKDRIIETDVDLVKSFGAERFRLLENEKPKPKAKDVTTPPPADVVDDEEESETDVDPDPDADTEENPDADVVIDADQDPVITLKAQHIGGGRYNVVKVFDGADTGVSAVNDETLSKEEAEALVEAGWEG